MTCCLLHPPLRKSCFFCHTQLELGFWIQAVLWWEPEWVLKSDLTNPPTIHPPSTHPPTRNSSWTPTLITISTPDSTTASTINLTYLELGSAQPQHVISFSNIFNSQQHTGFFRKCSGCFMSTQNKQALLIWFSPIVSGCIDLIDAMWTRIHCNSL